MSHVVTVPPEPFLVASGALEVRAIPAANDNFIWLIRCVETGTTAVVDGPDAGPLNGFVPDILLTTHTHHDHIGIHKDLVASGFSGEVVGSATAKNPVPGLTRAVVEGDTVTVGNVEAKVWLTEGHQNGHVSYVFDGAVFCGDTMFAGGCGYLFDGPPETMFASLLRLAELPGETLVCCAHEYTQDNLRFAWFVEPGNGALLKRIADVWERRGRGEGTVPSSIATERATNPFLRPGSPEIRARLEELVGLRNATMEEVFAATRSLKDTGRHKSVDDAELLRG